MDNILINQIKSLLLLVFLLLGCQQNALEEIPQAVEQDQVITVLSYFDSLQLVGDSLMENNLLDEAAALFQKVEQQSLEKENWPVYTEAYFQQAAIFNRKKQPDSSLMAANKLLTIAPKYLDAQDSIFAKAYFLKAEIFLRQGKRDSSIYYYTQSKPISKLNEQWESLTFACIGLGVNDFYAADYSKMEQELAEAFSTAKEKLPPDHHTFPIIFQLQGVLYDILGDYDQAINITQKALEVKLENENKEKSDSIFIGQDYNNLGAYFYSRGDYDQAIEYYDRARLIRTQLIDSAEMALTFTNLALVYAAKGQQEISLEMLQTSEALLSNNNSERGLSTRINIYNFIARNALSENMPEEALKYAHKALPLLAENSTNQFATYQHLGNAYRQLGKYELALDTLQLAVESFINIYGDQHPELADRYRMIAEVHSDLENYESTLEYCQKALKLLDQNLEETDIYTHPEIENSSHLLELIKVLSVKTEAIHKNAQDKENSEQDLKWVYESYQILAQLIAQLREEYLAIGSKQFLLKQSKAIYEKGIAVALELNANYVDTIYLQEAFAFAEKSKAILLAERLQDSEAKTHAEIPDSVLQQEETLKRDLAFYQKKIYDEAQKEKSDSLKNSVWQEKVFSLKRALEKYEADLENQYPEYVALKSKASKISLTQVQQELGEEDLLLEYFVGESQIYLFEISQNDLKVHTLEKPEDFEQVVMDFRNQLIRPATGNQKEAYAQFEAAANQLGQLLLGPALESEDVAKRLIIIPDEILHFIPFELLLTEAKASGNFASAPYLIKTHTVNYSYSAALLLNKKENSSGHSFHCLAFAPSYDEGAEPIAMSGSISRLRGENVALPGAQREVKALSKYFRGDFYFGAEASEQTFKTQAKDYQLIHLAMHGSAEEENPMYSKLYFTKDTVQAEDDTLFAYELYDMNLSADLVVLSACETGHGKFVQGEGVMSLASAFIHAGVPSVTMSLWEAQDEATAMIMENYYQNLSDGQAKDEALRVAKLAYLTKSGTQKHPFYWSAFVNIGNAEALNVGTNWYDWMRWGAVAFLGMFGLFFARRLWH